MGDFELEIRLFAVVRQLAGSETLRIRLSEGATIADVRRALIARLPELAALGPVLSFAVGEQYAGDSTPVLPTSDVACIPPVSGG